jgi:hypothetical protein
MHLLDTDIVFELRNAKAGATDPGPGRLGRRRGAVQPVPLGAQPAGAGDRWPPAPSARTRRRALTSRLAGQPPGPGLRRPHPAGRRRRRAAPRHCAAGRRARRPAGRHGAEHGLTLTTRDTAAFAKVPRLKLFNPWGYKPEALDDEEDWGQVAKAGSQWLRTSSCGADLREFAGGR